MPTGGGSIINTSSVAGLRGGPSLSPYSTSKFAVVGMTRSVAKEVAPRGIRINSIHPGTISSQKRSEGISDFPLGPVEGVMMCDLEQQLGGPHADKLRESFTAQVPIGRYVLPLEVAQIVLFLAGDESKACSGSQYAIDGGWMA
jgi:NAD(P)-dependent dehydrogenase (short-subunit alcohol dehydrogenase family)